MFGTPIKSKYRPFRLFTPMVRIASWATNLQKPQDKCRKRSCKWSKEIGLKILWGVLIKKEQSSF